MMEDNPDANGYQVLVEMVLPFWYTEAGIVPTKNENFHAAARKQALEALQLVELCQRHGHYLPVLAKKQEYNVCTLFYWIARFYN